MTMSLAGTLRDAVPLRIKGLSKTWKNKRALIDVDLEIRPGEIFALLGPNGAGKTTLIGSITGLVRPDSGSIEVFGWDAVAQFRQARRLIGLVPQEIGFDPFFTPRETLLLQMGLMGMQRDNARAESLLRTLSLWEQRDAYTRTLSGGMKRRLLVAKSLVHAPPLLFLDEPTAGVDVELRKDLWNEVARLRDAGTTVILTTHYIEEAERLADRIGVMHRGRLLLVEQRDTLMRRFGGEEVVIETVEPINDHIALPEGATKSGPTSLRIPLTETCNLNAILRNLTGVLEVRDLRRARRSLEDIFVDLIHTADREPTP